MTSEPGDFDLSAAWYRRVRGDLKAFMEAFATRMVGALPGRVAVARQHDSLFSSHDHVVEVTIDAEPNVYVLCSDKDKLSALRSKSVRGVTLKSEPMDLPEWLAALNADIQRLAERGNAARDVLHDFLLS